MIMRSFILGSAGVLLLAELPAQAATTPGLSLSSQSGGNNLITTSRIFEYFDGLPSGTFIGTNARVMGSNKSQ